MMRMWIETFSSAIDLAKQNRLEDAKLLFYKLLKEGNNQPIVLWSIGLLEVSTGYPYRGLAFWNRIPVNTIPGIPDKVSKVQGMLPEYDKMFSLYNDAISLITADRRKEAIELFEMIQLYEAKLRLPSCFYYARILLISSTGDLPRAVELMARIPDYCHDTKEMQLLSAKLQVESNKRVIKDTNVRYKSRIRLFILTLATVILVTLVGVVIYAFPSHSTTDLMVTKNINLNSPPDTEMADKLVKLEQSNSDLSKKINANEQKLKEAEETKDAVTAQTKSLEQLIILSNGSMESAKSSAAHQSYLKGLKLYNNRRYMESVDAFQTSKELNIDSFFTDDNLFYLINALLKLNRVDEATTFRHEFLVNKSKNFLDSPFLDDLLLEEAQFLSKQNNILEAILIYERLVREFPNEWTGVQAVQELQKLGK